MEEAKKKEETRKEDPLLMEIDEMLEIEPVVKNSPKSDTEETNEPNEDTDTGKDKKETPSENEEEEVPPTESGKPSTKEEEDEVETPDQEPVEGWEAERKELLDRIDKLTQMVEQLSEVKLQQAQQPPLTPAQEEEEDEEEPKPESQSQVQGPAEELDFLDGASIDILIDEPERLNQALNKVYQSALMEAERRVFEKVLTSIPDIVIGHINRQTTIQGIVKDFYDRNKDLVNVKRTVAAISNDVHAEHPDWEVGQVLEEAAKRTRELLGLRGPAQSRATEETPAFVKSGGAKTPRKQTTTLQDEIDELINFE